MHPSLLIQDWLKTHSTFKTLAFVSLYGGKLTRLVILNTSASRKIAIDHRNRATTVALKSV